MRTTTLTLIALIAAPAHAATQTRCGWFDHPSPNLVELIDADGLWSIAWPGSGTVFYPPGYFEAYTQAFDDRVRLDYSGRVTDYSYGFSCTCVEGEFGDDEVLSVSSLTERPIAACEEDPNLPDMQLYGQ